MTGDPIPEPDRIEGAPHPRETARIFGQAPAEAAFLDAFRSNRMHHGWLLTGPRGVGKATLAWRIARFLLATPHDDGGMFAPQPPLTLDIPDEHPVARRLHAMSEPRLFLLRQAWDEKAGRMRQDITVDEVRRMKSFFNLSAADGGRRVAIIDAADDLNVNAANALLKLLEEPPEDVTLLLIGHQPAGLLPTIRSRCREVRLSPLTASDMAAAMSAMDMTVDDTAALAELARGSVGAAVAITQSDGLALYARIIALFAGAPGLDRQGALGLADWAAQRGATARFGLTLGMLDLMLARLARYGVTGIAPPEAAKGEAALLARLAPDTTIGRHWADLAQSLGQRARRGRSVNLDPVSLLLDMMLKIDAAARMATR